MRARFAMSAALAVAVAGGCDSRSTTDAGKTGAAPARPLAASDAAHLASPAVVRRALRDGKPEQWFGMYVQRKKVGYASVSLRPDDGRAIWTVTGHIRAGGPGASSVAAFTEERLYAAEPPHRLVEIRSREDSGAGVVERVYRNGAGEMVVSQSADGRVQAERRLRPSQEDLLSVLDQGAIEPSEVRPGQSVSVFEFDSDTEREKKTTVKVLEVTRERLSGVETQVAVLSSQSEGEQTITRMRVASGGVPLRASFGEGIELRWEEKERAQSDVVGFDMIADAVEIDRPLGDAAAIRELRLVVGVAKDFTLRAAPNQEVERRPDGRLAVALFARPGPPVVPADRSAALAADGRADAGDPAVAELARKLTAGAGAREEKVGRLVDWVFLNLAKDLSSNLTTASQVLARRAGDCTEHALLFVALARAAAIPAREVSGLVYMGDELRRFGWHAWAEVDLDGRWVQVDPSWGEHVANATHLTLGVGDDSDWIATMGALTISLDRGR